MEHKKLKEIAQRMHDELGANLSAVKAFYASVDCYMIEANKEDRDAIKRANSIIDESCEKIREIYAELNKLV